MNEAGSKFPAFILLLPMFQGVGCAERREIV
jgi:hypothetical protein